MMKEASQVHLVVDTIIATVAFTTGVTMPGGFIGHDAGPHSGSPILIRNTAFKAFIIANLVLLPLFTCTCHCCFTTTILFCLSISAMGAMLLAFVTATFAVLMHSLGLAISNRVIIGLFFFIPALFIIIGCSHYYNELIWSMSCISWDFENVLVFGNLLEICGNVWLACGNLCVDLCYEAPKRYFLHCRRSQSSRNDADQSTPS
uniref:PGG domain-containing protein n=1 Tax=Quercus lobata TaxID=97700 RepID=A0A7N2MSQ9_QUELO